MEKKKVLVLLATYNGERYLKEQIDSILNQKNVDVQILVSDDSSKDNTLTILNDYVKKYNNIKYINSKCGSAQKNFYHLINVADLNYDYYALCDQDDIWIDDKLYSAIQLLDQVDDNKMKLYSGVSIPVDSEGNVLKTRKYNHYKVDSFESSIVASNTQGCTMVFNNSFIKKIKNKETHTSIMHDVWLHKTCLLLDGVIVFDSNPHMYYRQHTDNVFASLGKNKNFLNKIKDKIIFLFDNSQNFLRTSLIKEWKENFSNEIADEKNILLNEILSVNNSFKSKIKVIFSKKYISKYKMSYLKFVILVMRGKV